MSGRMETIRSGVRHLVRANPFHPFFLMMENGERIMVNHPENLAMDAGPEDGTGGSRFFYVIGDRLRHFGTFDAVTNVVTLDRAEV